MTIRSLTSLSLMTVLSFGLVACGDDGKPMLTTATTQPSTTNNPNTTNQNTTEPETGTETETETGGTEGMTEGTTVAPTTTLPTTTEEPVTTTTTEPATSTSTTSPATTDESTTTGEPAEGFYGPCDAMGGCPAGSECVMLEGLEGSYCSPACDGMTCPDTGVAGAQGQCVIVTMMGQDPTNCAAICQVANPDCPAGTTCKDVMMMGLGICTAP